MADSGKIFRAYPRLRVAGLYAGTLRFRAAGVKTQNFASLLRHQAASIPYAFLKSQFPLQHSTDLLIFRHEIRHQSAYRKTGRLS